MLKDELNEIFIDARLVEIKRHCDLIMLEFCLKNGTHGFIHLSCFFKILFSDKTIICSGDMFREGRNESKKEFNWDEPGLSIFDDCVKDNMELLCQSKIKYIQFRNNELMFSFDNNLFLEIIPDSSETEFEFYRIFVKDKFTFII